MAERSTAKSKRATQAKPAAKPRSAAQLAAENARLEQELAAARAKISELEQKNVDIINRIDWIIDSLHNLRND